MLPCNTLDILGLAVLTTYAALLDGAHMRCMPEIMVQSSSNNLLEHKVVLGNVSVPNTYMQSSIFLTINSGLLAYDH